MAGMYADIPELASQQAAIDRRRKIAEMLQQQSLEASPNQIPQRGFASDTAMPNAIAKIAQAFFGSKMAKEADTKQAGLADQYTQQGNMERNSVVKALQDKITPAQPEMPLQQDETGNEMYRPAIEEQRTPLTLQEKQQALIGNLGDLKTSRGVQENNLQQKYIESQLAVEQKAKDRLAQIEVAKAGRAESAAPKISQARIIDNNPNSPNYKKPIIVDGITGKFIGLDSGLDVGAQGSVAGAREQGKTNVKDATAQPQAKKIVGLVLQNNATLDAGLTELKNHKGLPGITGAIYGRVPSISDDSVDAQAVMDNVKNKVFASSLGSMREASKTGGAVGNVSDKEGDRLENMLGALSRVQTTKAFIKHATEIQKQIKISNKLIQDAYDQQYGKYDNTNADAGWSDL